MWLENRDLMGRELPCHRPSQQQDTWSYLELPGAAEVMGEVRTRSSKRGECLNMCG